MKSGANARKMSRKQMLTLFLIAAPGIIYLIINNYIPMAGLFVAFKDYNFMKGLFGSDWCGLKNFEFLFATKDAFIMTRNTILYNLAFIIVGTVFAIAIAIMLCELGTRLRVKFFQAALLMPNLLSWVVIGFIAFAFLSAETGFINKTILNALGHEPVIWYMEPGAWPFILLLVNLWKNAGYQSIVYMASIGGIDKALYEAAALDGATKMQQIFKITLPSLKPTVITLTLMSIGRMFYSEIGRASCRERV